MKTFPSRVCSYLLLLFHIQIDFSTQPARDISSGIILPEIFFFFQHIFIFYYLYYTWSNGLLFAWTSKQTIIASTVQQKLITFAEMKFLICWKNGDIKLCHMKQVSRQLKKIILIRLDVFHITLFTPTFKINLNFHFRGYNLK